VSRRPEYQREGWRPAGPRHCRCPHCGATVTTNALGRASHLRGCKKLREKKEQRTQK
jgi:hypothetical protein